jgi:type VI secretion system secreted protein Hcp
MAIFLNYDGIPGDVKSKGHEQWIEVSSFQWGIGRGINNSSAAEADREASLPSVSEIVVTKANDSASTSLMRASLGVGDVGKGKDVLIDFCTTASDGATPFINITLKNTLVSGWSISSGGDRPTETVTLNFTNVEFKNTPTDATTGATAPNPASYDLPTQVGG